jgi:hypothetical protein
MMSLLLLREMLADYQSVCRGGDRRRQPRDGDENRDRYLVASGCRGVAARERRCRRLANLSPP